VNAYQCVESSCVSGPVLSSSPRPQSDGSQFARWSLPWRQPRKGPGQSQQSTGVCGEGEGNERGGTKGVALATSSFPAH